MRIAGVAVLVVATACQAGGPGISGDRRNVGGVTVTFKAEPARAEPGRPVRLSIRLVNNAGTAEALTFPSGQRYDFWATHDGREVWRWSDDRFFTQAIENVELEAQTGLTFAETWTPEAAGEYVVHGVVTARGFDDEMDGEVSVR